MNDRIITFKTHNLYLRREVQFAKERREEGERKKKVKFKMCN